MGRTASPQEVLMSLLLLLMWPCVCLASPWSSPSLSSVQHLRTQVSPVFPVSWTFFHQQQFHRRPPWCSLLDPIAKPIIRQTSLPPCKFLIVNKHSQATEHFLAYHWLEFANIGHLETFALLRYNILHITQSAGYLVHKSQR
jgi:hypothetical protein